MKLETPYAEREVAALVAELKMLATTPAAIRVFSRQQATHPLPRTRRRLATALLLVLAGSLTAGLIWASRSHLEEVVRGEGKVIPDTSTQIIQSLEAGIVRDLLVAEGAHVKSGQTLLKMHDVQIASHYRENTAARDLLKARLLRLRPKPLAKPPWCCPLNSAAPTRTPLRQKASSSANAATTLKPAPVPSRI